ncbi:MAG: hypothetical protein COV08_01485 [Candidatus Vogelbacteria bacterium CG10_big_fil_rev_8_21_14_0_10_49_38]|uniref:phenylalanine--tRNA ligase n=1 Tax=Candidatus Vogelbacteria bacterium CG10_big_fil_rev_8_21_14_0_10_49_38 TaxID=1975043 RepID=A0A2H0RHP1_9BACT|nr:MAG: hypothetical protein BK006_01500 [bacterium CG10_49_38]PIR46072.1 MAG: hypothetical protein COV08_01485 [Candidatus Vogelbacteria bacterium CG10_big_fil_rev_8_21_14_0_10_49_38]
MRFTYRQLADYFTDNFPSVAELAEGLTFHAWEVEDVAPLTGEDLEFEVKILPDRAGDAKTPAGLAREINAIWPELKPKEPWSTVTADSARQEIVFSVQQINDILGLNLKESEISSLLRRVGVEILGGENKLTALVPPARSDLNLKEDLADEIIRLYGYNQLPSRLLAPRPNKVGQNAVGFSLANRVRAKFVAAGYAEVYSYTFVNDGEFEIEKALASDKTRLRTNLTDGLRRILEANLDRALFDTDEVKLFEIGTVFVDGREEMMVASAVGRKKPELKIEIEEKSLSLWSGASLPAGDLDPFIAGEVHYRSVSPYPRIVRDLAVWVPKAVEAQTVSDLIKQTAGEWRVEGPVLFDEFAKDGKKSLAFRLSFQAPDRTLADPEINEIMAKIGDRLATNSDWQVR